MGEEHFKEEMKKMSPEELEKMSSMTEDDWAGAFMGEIEKKMKKELRNELKKEMPDATDEEVDEKVDEVMKMMDQHMGGDGEGHEDKEGHDDDDEGSAPEKKEGGDKKKDGDKKGGKNHDKDFAKLSGPPKTKIMWAPMNYIKKGGNNHVKGFAKSKTLYQIIRNKKEFYSALKRHCQS